MFYNAYEMLGLYIHHCNVYEMLACNAYELLGLYFSIIL
jgi:hypothetical protein